MVPAVNKFMDDNVLRRLAAILPATEEEFIGIVGNNSTDSKKYKYFKDIFIDLRKRRIERMCNLSSNFAFNEEGQSQIDTMEIQTTSRFFNNTDENKNLVSLTPYEQSTQVSKGVNARTAGGKKYKRNFNYKRYRNYNKWKK
ncbi:Sgs1 RecQ helicase [Nakaseomyces glabratus]